jgi:hypothetical protein
MYHVAENYKSNKVTTANFSWKDLYGPSETKYLMLIIMATMNVWQAVRWYVLKEKICYPTHLHPPQISKNTIRLEPGSLLGRLMPQFVHTSHGLGMIRQR